MYPPALFLNLITTGYKQRRRGSHQAVVVCSLLSIEINWDRAKDTWNQAKLAWSLTIQTIRRKTRDSRYGYEASGHQWGPITSNRAGRIRSKRTWGWPWVTWRKTTASRPRNQTQKWRRHGNQKPLPSAKYNHWINHEKLKYEKYEPRSDGAGGGDMSGVREKESICIKWWWKGNLLGELWINGECFSGEATWESGMMNPETRSTIAWADVSSWRIQYTSPRRIIFPYLNVAANDTAKATSKQY